MTQTHASRIARGPFKDVEVALTEVRTASNEDDAYVFDTRTRTPYFLERYPPEQFPIEVQVTPLDLQLPARDADGNAYVDSESKMLLWPTMLVTARLHSPEGKVLRQVQVLAVLAGPNDLAGAQTRAIGTIYELAGLPTMLNTLSFTAAKPLPTTKEASVEPAAEATTPVVPSEATAASGAAHVSPSAPVIGDPMAGVRAVESTARKYGSAPAAPAPAASEAATPAANEASASPEAPAPAAAEAPAKKVTLNPGLLSQARNRAALRKVELPEFTSNEAIQLFLAEPA